MANFLTFIAKRQPSSRYLLAGSRDTANESRYDGSWRYDGSRWHDDKLVIPLLVSG
ncbi:hypothetical protein [Wolbachia endosymbiont (group A) of Platycheirus albimanus]|uniref:hypothetical protein n=1 Tax=Wolbachia endosymbiont (group A) of Platycheirus albimanus TaxID=2954048 RepID=UPI00221E8DA3|nr:hypothetical protein [Wolbachia endosymbiont (group A) of Platycheirus albimanus]